MCLLVKYQKIGEMNSEYPFLFYLKSDFWMEIPDDKVNHLKNKKTNAQNDVCLEQGSYPCTLALLISLHVCYSTDFRASSILNFLRCWFTKIPRPVRMTITTSVGIA